MTPCKTQPGPPALPADMAPLEARHVAQAVELRQVVADLPVGPGARVLDVACGDGYFAGCLAGLVGPGGLVAAFDVDPAVLRYAGTHGQFGHRRDPTVRFLRADAAAVPFGADSFDAAWCAHSLISLPDPTAVLAEVRRVVRPGGVAAVLENDVFHCVILPWPAELELALYRAEREAYRARNRRPRRLHPSRRLGDYLSRAGLVVERRTSHVVDRRAPLGDDDLRFITLYLQQLWRRTHRHLSSDDRTRCAPLVDPRDPRFLPRQPQFSMTCLDVLTVARVPVA